MELRTLPAIWGGSCEWIRVSYLIALGRAIVLGQCRMSGGQHTGKCGELFTGTGVLYGTFQRRSTL